MKVREIIINARYKFCSSTIFMNPDSHSKKISMQNVFVC